MEIKIIYTFCHNLKYELHSFTVSNSHQLQKPLHNMNLAFPQSNRNTIKHYRA
uniref:Uncharacterized protein n=1 Tax=Anguilla anguilla TaxID=7936 RepID=A0A0E9QKA6_ANGAN